jgi:hypothetical protein
MYIHIQTLIQRTESEIRALNPNTSYPVPFPVPEGYAYVFPTAQPVYNPVTQTVQQTTPELTVLDTWEQRWEVVEIYQNQQDKDDAIAASLIPIRAARNAAIRAERDRRKFNGVLVSAKWIHTDTYSRTQWMGMVMMGASVPAIEWTTMDGTSITTSQALAGAVFQGTATLDATLFAYAKSLIAQVDASSDPTSVDITTGWPATFEGV